MIRLKALRIADLRPEHHFPVAGENISAGGKVVWDIVNPDKIYPNETDLHIGICRFAAKAGEEVQIHPLKGGVVVGISTIAMRPMEVGQPDYDYVLVIEEHKQAT